MTTPGKTESPWQLQHPPEQWQAILTQALGDLRKNHQDEEALAAIRDANEALGVYDAAQAATPGERIASGIREGAKGLGQAALDVPRSLIQMATHPIQTIANLPRVPGELVRGVTQGDQSQVARTVGDVGGLLLPFAKTSRAVGAPTVGAVVSRAVTTPIRAAKALMERPGLTNELIRARTARATQALRPREGGKTTPPEAVMRRALDEMDTPTYLRRGGIPPRINRTPPPDVAKPAGETVPVNHWSTNQLEQAGPRTVGEMARLAKALRDLPTDQLELQAKSPLVEDWVQAAARQELARRVPPPTKRP